MWQKLVKWCNPRVPLPAPMHKDNVLMITTYIKRGVVVVTHKGKVKTAKFNDNTLRNMVNGVKFRKNAESFMGAVAQLLEQLTKR